MKPSRMVIVLEKMVPRFPHPKPGLEQYRTPPEAAVQMAGWLASRGCRLVVDLGAGTGMITYAAGLYGLYAVGLDVDVEALSAARGSALYRVLVVDFVAADALAPPLRRAAGLCVAQNPPFGLRGRRGVDSEFLSSAASLGAMLVASIHHAGPGSLEHLERLMAGMGYRLLHVEGLRLPIPAALPGHVRRVYYVPAASALFSRVQVGGGDAAGVGGETGIPGRLPLHGGGVPAGRRRLRGRRRGEGGSLRRRRGGHGV